MAQDSAGCLQRRVEFAESHKWRGTQFCAYETVWAVNPPRTTISTRLELSLPDDHQLCEQRNYRAGCECRAAIGCAGRQPVRHNVILAVKEAIKISSSTRAATEVAFQVTFERDILTDFHY